MKDESGTTREVKAFSVIDDVYTQHGTNEIIEIFNDAQIFPFPKPTGLLKKLVNIGASANDDIVLDIFSGSASMADCILNMNQQDGGNRKFICIQLPEVIAEDTSAYKAGYRNISDVGKERIRRAISKIAKKEEEVNGQTKNTLFESSNAVRILDLGFKVFKLQPSNFNIWYSDLSKNEKNIQTALDLHVQHILPNARQESILYELLLKSGFELSTPIEKIEIQGKTIFTVENGELIICLEKHFCK